MDKFRKRFPFYKDDTDYTTNAPSYYDDLARKTKLIQYLAEKIIELSKDTELTIQEFADRLADIKEEMKDFFAEWLIDGTLEEIINERVFTEINQGLNNVSTEVQEARMNVINETFPTLKERLDTDFQVLTQTITDDKTDVMDELQTLVNDLSQLKTESEDALSQLKTESEDALSQLQNEKKNKTTGLLYLADFEKLLNETDDQFINRILSYLPNNQGTLILEGKQYNLTDTIYLSRYQSLKGAGHATILSNDQTAKDIIKITNDGVHEYAYGVSIEDLQVIGGGLNTGIHLNKSTHIQIRNVYIYETQWGIWGVSTWLATYDRVTIRNYTTVGELGFYIAGGTSNVLNNVWVKNFKKGFQLKSIYSTLNSCACDTFTEFAYSIHQNAVLNGCGAEDAMLVNGGCVFWAGARGVTFNSCEIMGIGVAGSAGSASIFDLDGTACVINNFRTSGTFEEPKIDIIHVDGGSHVNVNNTRINSYNENIVFKETGKASTVLERVSDGLKFHRWNGTKTIVME